MPNNGTIIDWLALEYNCHSSASISGTGPGDLSGSHSAEAYTQFAPDAIDLAVGIALTAESQLNADGSGSWEVSYNGPGAPFGGYIVSGSTFLSSVSIKARAKNVKMYCKLTGSLWRILWSAVEIYVNGSLNITLPGSAIDLVSAGVGQNYVPIIGVPLHLSGGCGASKTNIPSWTYNPCDPGEGLPLEWSATASGSASGGWRFQEPDGTWVSLPVKVYETDPPSGSGCPFGLSAKGVVTAANTWDASIATESYGYYRYEYIGRENGTIMVIVDCKDDDLGGDDGGHFEFGPFDGLCVDRCTGTLGPLYRDIFKTTSKSRGQSGTVTLVPNLERAIKRLGSSYRALWFRGSFPQCLASASRTCEDGAVSVSTSSNPEVYPAVSEFLGCVGATTHAIEDPFGREIYCPTSAGRSRIESETFSFESASVCVCPPPGTVDAFSLCPGGHPGIACPATFPDHDNTSKSESVGYSFPSYVSPDEGGNQWHADGVARYIATWSCPHWQFFFWRADWDVDGSPTPFSDYWGPIDQQWLDHVALPGGERRKTRNSVILSPFHNEQGSTPFLDAFASGLRWIGVSRWKTQEVSLPSSLLLSQTRHGEWNSRDVGGTPDISSITYIAGGIRLSGFNVTTPAVLMEFGSWNDDPFLLLDLAKTIAVGWDAINVSSMTISLVGFDDEETVLGTTQTTYTIPKGAQSKYAGSWGIDNGAGVVSDTGTDTLANGISSAVMGDDEGSFDFQLGHGRMYKAVKFEFTPSVPANPILIHYPTIGLHSVHPEVYWESGKTAALVWGDGPALRWGQWTFYIPGLGFLYPPLPTGLGFSSTIIDWLAFKYRVLRGDGGSSLASRITTELSSLYDSYEGQSIAVVDKFSRGVILPKGLDEIIRGALINSFAEVPPMSCFPFRKRDPSWKPVGAMAQVVYDLTEEDRNLISPVEMSANLTKPDDTPVGASAGIASGWHRWKFAPALDNTETDWKVKVAGSTIGLVRPWIGWLTVPAEAEVAASDVWNLTTRDSNFLLSWVDTGGAKCQWWDYLLPLNSGSVVTIDSDTTCEQCRVYDDHRNRIYAVIGKNDDGDLTCWRAWSDDTGRTWSGLEAMGITNGRYPHGCSNPHGDRLEAAFVYDSGTSGPGTIKVLYRSAGDTSFAGPATCKDSTGTTMKFVAGSFGLHFGTDGASRVILSAVIDGETSPSSWFSTDALGGGMTFIRFT